MHEGCGGGDGRKRTRIRMKSRVKEYIRSPRAGSESRERALHWCPRAALGAGVCQEGFC